MNNKMKPAIYLPSTKEALDLIDNSFDFDIQVETINIFDASERILAEDVFASEFVPSFNRSAMDGYSVITSDVEGASKEKPIILKKAFEVLMGESTNKVLEHGICAYTPTGAFVPEGTQSVVMVEDTKDNGDGTISFFKDIQKGKNVTLKGDDVFPGKKVFSKGRKLNISDIGAFAAMGISKVKVNKKPLIAILSTGDELIDINEIPREGQIRDINSTTLALLINQNGGIAKNYGIVKDEEDILLDTVKKAVSECDMVLISGGSSMGEKDATEKIVEKIGELILHGIRMKPGKPTIIGKIDNKPVFGVPGHPVSAFFVTRIFVKRVLEKMIGQKNDSKIVEAILTSEVKPNKERTVFTFAKLYKKDNDLYFVEPLKTQSGLITSMAECDGFFEVDYNCDGFKEGDKVFVNII